MNLNIINRLSVGWFNFLVKAPPVILFVIGTFYAMYILTNLEKDTVQISNIAFGITAVLAGLTLRLASTLSIDDKDKDRFLYSGERFVHASILLLSGSILKYASITVKSLEYFMNHNMLEKLLTFPLGIFITFLFFYAVHSAHAGLTITTRLLWERQTRVKDWDSIL